MDIEVQERNTTQSSTHTPTHTLPRLRASRLQHSTHAVRASLCSLYQVPMI